MAGRNIQRFVVQLNMGDDAMQTLDDIAAALDNVAAQLRRGKRSGLVSDINGNTVGDYAICNKRGDTLRRR